MSGSRQGVLRIVTGTDVAANTEFSETVPAGKYWQLLTVAVTMVQGATQTPQPTLIIDDGTNTQILVAGATTAQSASTTARYHWGGGLQAKDLTGSTPNIWATAPLPDAVLLSPGWRVRSTTTGIGANSNYGPPTLVVVEFDRLPGTEFIV
jgi:hypothetical protein